MRVAIKELYKEAYGNYGIGAFNVFNAEQVHGVFRGARKCNTPVIIQLTPVARNYLHPEFLQSLLAAAEKVYPEVTFTVHLDHGTVDHCLDAINSGYYNSVMIDASHESFQENIRITSEIVRAAHARNIAVEAELGVLSGVEDNLSVDDKHALCTDPKQAKEFISATQCDSLAIAVGTSHGAYKFTGGQKLQLNILKEIYQLVPGFPLVLHGASAVPLEEVKRINSAGGKIRTDAKGTDEAELLEAIKLGVCKVNIATDMRLIWTRIHREFFNQSPEKFDMVVPGNEYMDELEVLLPGNAWHLKPLYKIFMKRDKKCPLLIKEDVQGNRYQKILSSEAGWTHLNMEARILKMGETWVGNTGGNEYIFVLMGGNFDAQTSEGNWQTVNGRKNVFSGLPHGLYLSQNTSFTITATSEVLDLACSWCESDQVFPAQFITPGDVQNMGIEYRGGDNASRQINRILPPGSKCQRMVCVEVYTPSGNWSSFPAHKHDTRKVDPETGKVLEACLEEIYFYKMDKPQGFALQKVYTDDRSLDEIAEPHNNDAVLVPRGYHPVIAGHGYHVYYLNFLAGSDQSLMNTDDPDHKWIYGTWKGMDPRIPMVTKEMNNQ